MSLVVDEWVDFPVSPLRLGFAFPKVTKRSPFNCRLGYHAGVVSVASRRADQMDMNTLAWFDDGGSSSVKGGLELLLDVTTPLTTSFQCQPAAMIGPLRIG